jgi:ABC-type Fe3+ transport system substrate-binding protein
MEDPVSNVSMTALIATIIQHGDELAVAYKDLYGKDYTTDPAYGPDTFGLDTPDAGWLWARKMAQNKPGIQPGGGEVDESYALPGMNPNEDPGSGISGYSSMEDVADGKLVLAPCVGIKPVLGIFKTTYLAVATNAPHPNAAKLFIKFVLSEEGRQPWNIIGDYPAVEGQLPAKGAMPLADLKVWTMDDVYIYQNASRVRDFWAVSLLYAPEE